MQSVVKDDHNDDKPQVARSLWAGSGEGGAVIGDPPAPRPVISSVSVTSTATARRLYEHVYLSSERYAWQCLQGSLSSSRSVSIFAVVSVSGTNLVSMPGPCIADP